MLKKYKTLNSAYKQKVENGKKDLNSLILKINDESGSDGYASFDID